MLGICLPFHYHFEIKESCSEIIVDTNVTVWKELIENSESKGWRCERSCRVVEKSSVLVC